jgi:hypothetical protein
MCLYDDGLVAFVGTAGVHIVTHDVENEVKIVILVEVIIPLKRIVGGYQALEEALRSIEVLVQRLGAVVPGIDEILGASREEDGKGTEGYNDLFHFRCLLES